MADFTALIAQIEAYVKQNGNNEITGNGLQDILVAMVGAIGGALNDAVSDLESADTTLTNAIGDEELARQGGDSTLGGRISAEEEARAGADTGLQNQINGINGKIPDAASNTNKLADKAFVQGLVDALTASIEAINDKIPSEASSSNKLADKEFVQVLTTALQNALNTLNGKVPAAATSENQLADKAFVQVLTTALQNAINAINTNIGNGFVYAGVATPSGTPVSGKVAYLTAQEGTYTNYGGLFVPAGISVIKYDGTDWSQEQVISMETIYRNPLMGLYDCDTSGSMAAKTVTAAGYVLPTSGGSVKVRMASHTTVDGVTLNINGTGAKDLYYKGKAAGINNTWDDGAVLNIIYDSTNDRYLAYNANAGTGDGVFDVSEYTGDDYAKLEDAIADIPVSEQHGGMMMRFVRSSVRSSDNKYVQYRYMGTATTGSPNPFLDTANWQGVDDKPTAGSDNLVKSGGAEELIGEQALNNYHIGKGNNPVIRLIYGLIPEKKYRLTFVDNDWDRDDVTVQAWIFALNYIENGVIGDDIIHVQPGGSIPKTVEFEYGEWECLRVSIRANVDTVVRYTIEPANVVRTDSQTLTDEEKEQARENIGIETESIPDFGSDKYVLSGNIAKYTSLSSIKAGVIINGTNVNSLNTDYVHTKCMYIGGMKKLRFYTNRPNATGCEYRVGFCCTGSNNDIGKTMYGSTWASQLGNITISIDCPEKVIDLNMQSWGESAVGIMLTIGEYNPTTSEVNPLRSTDFDGYDVGLIVLDGIDERTENLNWLSLWSDLGVNYTVFGNVGLGYVGYDTNNKKHISVTNNVRYISVPIEYIKKYIELSGFTYTPSTGSESTYTVIIFFDSENNFISRVNTATDGIMSIEKPVNAAYCYIDIPYAHISEIVIKSYDVRNIEMEFDKLDLVDKKLGLRTFDGIPFNSFDSNVGVVTWDSTTKKKVINTSVTTASHIKVPIDILDEVVEVFGFTYKPSTASQSTYTRIVFFDDENNYLSDKSYLSRNPFEKFALSIPSNAAQCYICAPNAYKNLLFVKCYPDLSVYDEQAIVEANKDRKAMLTSSCRLHKTSNTSKDFQMLIATDSHGDVRCVNNAIVAANCYDVIDAFIHCGDSQSNVFTLGENVDASWKDIVAKSFIPCYFVMGNHEKGTYPCIYGTPTDIELHNAYIKPIKDNFWISGGYVQNKCYYYRDWVNAQFRIRLIVLDEYEAPFILDDTYWEAITYNSELTAYGILNGESFSQGDEINVLNYTDYSFRAKQNIASAKYSDFTGPSYKYRRGYRWISQSQAQWFLDTLASTPSGYSVIVACHNPFSALADVEQDKMFSQKNEWINGGPYLQNYMTNDFIADAINAYQKRLNFTTTCESMYPTDMPSYQVTKDFSSAQGTFHSLIGGHVHQDCVWKHQTYNQYQITPIDTNSNAYQQSTDADIRRSSSETEPNSPDTNCLTAISFGSNRIGLVKLGVNVTETGAKRDYEVIDTSD